MQISIHVLFRCYCSPYKIARSSTGCRAGCQAGWSLGDTNPSSGVSSVCPPRPWWAQFTICMGVWDQVGAAWVNAVTCPTLDREEAARLRDKGTGCSLENGGCIGDPHIVVDVPIRVAWRDAQGSQEAPLGSPHRIVARDPPLCPALFRGLHDWETSHVVSSVWVTSRHFSPSEWALMQEVGNAGAAGLGVVGEQERGWGDRRRGGGGSGRPPPPRLNPPMPSRNPTPSPSPLKKSSKERFACESGSESDDALTPRGKKPNPTPTTTARPTKAVAAAKPTNPPNTATPPPPPTKTHTPEGATAEKKDDRPGDPIIETVGHVPYPTGVEKGTVRGIQGRKYGAVSVEYPGGTTLYEVPWHLFFPTAEEAKRYREVARMDKKKPKPPAPENEETNLPNRNPTTEPTNPDNPPSGPTKTWDRITGSHEVLGPA